MGAPHVSGWMLYWKKLGPVVNWSIVDKRGLSARHGERSPIRDTTIKAVLKEALTDKIDDRQVYT